LYREQNLLSTQSYTPQPYPKAITLFRAAENYVGAGAVLEPELGWRDLAHGGLEMYEIPGSHLGMLQDPSAQVLGKALSRCIAKATGERIERSQSASSGVHSGNSSNRKGDLTQLQELQHSRHFS